MTALAGPRSLHLRPLHELFGRQDRLHLFGLGLGLVFLAGASTGGSDIIAKLLRKKFRRLKLSRLMLILDIITVTLTGVVFHDITRTLYSVLPLYVSALVMDGVIYGLDYSSLALIISDHYAEIVQTIGLPFTSPATSPACTIVPISSS